MATVFQPRLHGLFFLPDGFERAVLMLLFGKPIGIRPNRVIDGLRGYIGPVLLKQFHRAGLRIDKCGNVPGFLIRQLWRAVRSTPWHIVFYIPCKTADAIKTRAGGIAVLPPERGIYIQCTIGTVQAFAV